MVVSGMSEDNTVNQKLNSLGPLGTRVLKLSLPFLIIALYLVILRFLLSNDDFMTIAGLMFLYVIPPAGKETIIPIGVSIGLPWYLVAFSIALMDSTAALFMVWNFDLSLKIPVLGRWIEGFMSQGTRFFGKHQWIERLSAAGLAIFVMFPLQGTGGIAGSLVGRMMGMDKFRVFISITVGALVGCFLIALGTEYIRELFMVDVRYGTAAIIIVIAVIVIAYFSSEHNRKKLKTRLKMR